jgi:dolichol-phosphate mannosyltransferase
MISLVIPTYKECQNVEPLVERAGTALAATGEEFELILVDDASPDGTAEEVSRLQADRPWLKLLRRKNERDLSTAVVAGWRLAQGDVLGCMDADLQHPPELLPHLLRRLRRDDCEIVVASRQVPGGGVSQWSLLRRLLSWTAALMATFTLPGTLGTVHDPMSGFFLLRRSVLKHAVLNPIGYKILLEVLAKGDYAHLAEVPYIFEERRGGSKAGFATMLKYLAHLLRLSLDTGEAFRVVKYALVGLTGAIVNFVSLRWLSRALGWSVPVAALAGAGLAIVNNFIWHERFTFWETRRAEPGWRRVLRRFAAFAGFSAAGVAINVLLICLLVVGLGFPLTPSVVVGIGIAALWNFFTNSNVTWRAWWNRKVLSHAARAPRLAAPPAGIAPPGRDNLVWVPCNLCQSTRTKVFHAGNSQLDSRLPAQIFRCTSERHGDFTNIVQCSDCGLIYENPREQELLLNAQYAQVEDPTYERETSGRVRTFSKLLDSLQRHAAAGCLLDIGCYTGIFLELARQRGWQTLGIEPATWAARKAQEKGLEVINAPFLKAAIPAESFDVVTMWDVIEHLHDPLRALREVRRILRPCGILGLSTMDAGSVFAKLAARRWPWYMRMHLYYFTPGTLTEMLKAAGFEVLTIEHHRRTVSVRYFLEKAAASLNASLAPLGCWVGGPFGRFHVSVDLGDIMNVFSVRSPRPGGPEGGRAD